MDVPAAVRTLINKGRARVKLESMGEASCCGPERRGRFEATDMAKGGFVAKFVLSCA